MRILVIGSGGREHALVWKLAQSPLVESIVAAPGNAGTLAEGALNVPVDAGNIEGLVALARQERTNLVVPGPELPLTLGITDRMRNASIPTFGPDAYCAQLEGSKAFAKGLMEEAGIPTAPCQIFTNSASAIIHLAERTFPAVIKADGLAAGKGVIVAKTREEAEEAVLNIMDRKAFGSAGDKILIEDCLVGEEASLLCLCDGVRAVPLPSAQDHKRVFDGDEGPNTGGMGAYSPAPVLPDAQIENMTALVMDPVLREMARRGHPFIGVLYAGLMLTEEGPKVLEYNVRFGDPECQPLLMRLESDLAAAMRDCLAGGLGTLAFSPMSALGIVLAAKGYPGTYPKGIPIGGVREAEAIPKVKVFHSGTQRKGDEILSTGGRVLCVTALGDGLAEAQRTAYRAMNRIVMENAHFRRDIGEKGLRRLQDGQQPERKTDG